MAITTRSGKGAALTNNELDTNFVELDQAANHAVLVALRGLSPSADKLAYFTGVSTLALTTITSSARDLLAASGAAAMQAVLGVVPGTDVQAQNANLSALAGLTLAAGKLPYGTGAGTMSTTDLTAYARELLDDVDAPAARTTLGVSEASDSEVWAGTDGSKVVTARRIYSANKSQPLVDGATITPPAGWNFHGTLGATGRTINPPSTLVDGQAGRFALTTGGNWSINWHSSYKKIGSFPSTFASGGPHIFGYYYDGAVLELSYAGQRAA